MPIRWGVGIAVLLCSTGCSPAIEGPGGSSASALTEGDPYGMGGAPSTGLGSTQNGGGSGSLATLLANCQQVSSGGFSNKQGSGESIPICGLRGGVFWTADMDIDCDGQTSNVCNRGTDPDFQSQTSGSDSHGQPLDAATVPFIVVPLPSERFDYRQAEVELGDVAMVIYNGQYAFGVVGDLGPKSIIGEASVAMADQLGIPSNPSSGGASDGVTYVVFTGSDARVMRPEDPSEVSQVGQARLARLLQEN
jgi:hypothetical protein